MAGIEHDERPRIGGIGLRHASRADASARAEFFVERDFAQETVAVGRDQIEHQPRRRAVGRIDDKGLVDARRLGQVEHHARAARHHQPEAERLDQPSPALAGLRRQLKRDLRDVEDDAIGIGQRKDVQIDLAVEIHDEARLRLVAAEPRVGRHRK